MSRKTASFDQLIAYMDSEKSDAYFDVHHNCYARGQAGLTAEFLENSRRLKRRKNGNVLYHEIVSITLEEGVARHYAKECLREIALSYIEARCPRNMVYGALHEDHADHLHYHLLISANERGEERRFWHSKSEFDRIKRDLEEHVLKTYPELKQRRVVTAKTEDKARSRKAAEMTRQKKKLTKQEQVRDTIVQAMMHTTSLGAFHANLSKVGYTYYARGKHHGVIVQSDDGQVKKYRFATIGVHESFEEFLGVLEGFKQAEEAAAASDAHTDEAAGAFADEKEKQRDEARDDVRAQSSRSERPAGEREKPKEEPMREDGQEHVSGHSEKAEAAEFLEEMRARRARRAAKKAQRAAKTGKRPGKPRR